MTKQYEIVIRTKIIHTGDNVPPDAIVISPIKEAIRDKVKLYQATYYIDSIIDKVELIEEDEGEEFI